MVLTLVEGSTVEENTDVDACVERRCSAVRPQLARR